MLSTNTSYNTYNYSTFGSFKTEASKDKKTSRLPFDEAMEQTVAEGLEKVIKLAKKESLESDTIKDATCTFEIPESGNEAAFSIKTDKNSVKDILSISVKKNDLDRMVFSVLTEGTLFDIEEFIEKADKKEIGRQIDALSRTVDNFYFSSFYYAPILNALKTKDDENGFKDNDFESETGSSEEV